jgi:hypothetical protein
MKITSCRIALLLAWVALAGGPAYAQGGGASSSGTIQGRVTDPQGAALAGVTVTAISPSAMGAQTTATTDAGTYRFPSLPPGIYSVAYELPGFTLVKHDGVPITLGFTAHVDVTLALSTLHDTLTMRDDAALIDSSTTRIAQTFIREQLESLPGRDMWSLLGVVPGVHMSRIDIGGNLAGQQTPYRAYGQLGQVRVLIEGINITEGTSGAGFYFDYSSLDQVLVGTAAQSAEMPHPGVQSQFVGRSGGNRFSGEYYLDWYNNSLQGSNIPESYTVPTAFNNQPFLEHSNEIDRYYDTAINAGGAIKRDKVWWFATYREQFIASALPNFRFGKTFDTKLWNAAGKGTYQASTNHKFVGYYQWGQKVQPNRPALPGYTYVSEAATNRQDSGSWVYKAEWNATLSDRLSVEARYGDFGYYFPLLANGSDPYFWRDSGTLEIVGSHTKNQSDRDLKQWSGSATYFLDTTSGSHTVRAGAELLKELLWVGFLQGVGGNIEHVYSNGASNQVIFRIPTATAVGGSSDKRHLTSRNALDSASLFLTDAWAIGRLTVNGGVRWDRYKGWLPEQLQLGQTVGPVTVAARTFEKRDLYTWNVMAPRVGVAFDLSGDGRLVLKGHYGLYWHNPGIGVSSNANPNTPAKNALYTWNDRLECAGCVAGDRRWQPGEETSRQSAALEGSIQLDPNLDPPYTHEAAGWFERQFSPSIELRAGFVYKTEDDLVATYIPGRGLDVYQQSGVPFNFVDIGVDGVRNTADDRNIPMVGLPSANAETLFPDARVVMNVPQFARYKTVQTSVSKRYSDAWSATLGLGYVWSTDFPNGYPQNPNQPGAEHSAGWGVKVSGWYDAPYGIRLSPVVRYQSGSNYARTYTIAAPTGVVVTGVNNNLAFAEPTAANRENDIVVFDVRTEKSITLVGRLRMRVFVDAFNITNSHASESISRATGSAYQRPTAILAPFTARVGFTVVW